ncbi:MULTISPECIES: tyrosine-type recombinase/integrase [Thermobifida]|uniref:tyrosine-type recombinase/integrase n=1 Tax=Thermobifida TaxID=83677 RepID=UPI0020D24D26|nr:MULTISPECIES: tyrosine-type recombinase/integrase [Thermobifida]MDD6792036.1 tyrosine-type recombinase/integrase [Thermobifida fusca]
MWTPAQLKVFLEEAARSHRLWAFFHVAAYTGARRGELLWLRWSDVDLDAAEIRIARSVSVIDGRRVESSTKSERTRVVGFGAETVAVLRRHRVEQDRECEVLGEAWKGDPDGYVFTTA